MDYPIHTAGPYTVIALSGDVDLQHSPQARKQILHHVRGGAHVLIDLAAVRYIDSSGVASLVEGFQLAREQGCTFGLAGVSDTALQVLHLARLDKVFAIRPSITDWLQDADS